MRLLTLLSSIVTNRRGGVPAPSWCTYLVTYRCNARCRMCDSWQIDGGDEMTVDDVAAVFDKVGTLDVVRLSGGEPFLRSDLPDIAETVMRTSTPKVLHITTNGSFGDRAVSLAENFSAPKRLRLMVSFDGLAETHDANRGRAVTFDRAMDTVKRLVEVRRRRGIEVSVNHTVITAQSMADSDELRRIFADMQVDMHTVLAYADSSMYGSDRTGTCANDLIGDTFPLHPDLADTDAVGFVERELERSRTIRDPFLKWGKKYYLQGLRDRLDPSATPTYRPRCVALRSHIRILPDGSVPVCQFNTATVGNLRSQSFDDVWHNGRSTPQRKWVDACPGCWAECEVVPNAIYSGNIITRSK